MANKIVLLGGGGHSRVVYDLIENLGYDVLGYTAPDPSSVHRGIPYLGTDIAYVDSAPDALIPAALGIGKTDASAVRVELMQLLIARAIVFPVLRSENSIVHGGVEMGDGTVVLDGATIVTGTAIGRACIINTNASVNHDCALGDDVHIAPGAVICGDVRVGASTFIGAGAVVTQGITIAENCVIGAGSTVISDIEIPGTYVGSPARRLE